MQLVANTVADGLGRITFIFRFVFKQAGCISEAQSWEKMVKSLQAEEKDSAWSKLVSLPKLSVNFIVQSYVAALKRNIARF